MAKIKLSFVKGGKEAFEIPKMTVRRQEELMTEMVKLEKEMETDEYNREMNRLLILKSLQIVDPNVTMENILEMHPDDYIELFTQIWNAGREIKKDNTVNFRRKKD